LTGLLLWISFERVIPMTITSEEQHQTVTNSIAGVRFYEIGKLYHFSCDHLPGLQIGDFVVVETTRGRQLGQVMSFLAPEGDDTRREYKPILRMATATDLMNQKLWKAREVEALIACREKAAEIGGFEGTKCVAAQYNFDGTLLTFMFTSDDKLNTTKLRSALQRNLKARIEMRQIGPRDVAKLLGGMGACGIPRCCSTFLTDFSPISIKMAKAQGISLNPTEITGMCGRLRCCLIYEYEQYVEARKQLPRRNKRIGTPHGEGKVIDVHPLRDAVTVLVEDTMYLVEREEIIPLEEWEALKAKADAGCSKHDEGPCECGARQGKSTPAEEDEDEGEDETSGASSALNDHEETGEVEKTDEPQPHKRGRGGQHRGRSRQSGRRRRPRGKRPNKDSET
jgi:cell fate regulator YaaT (PSP1 superfamily)